MILNACINQKAMEQAVKIYKELIVLFNNGNRIKADYFDISKRYVFKLESYGCNSKWILGNKEYTGYHSLSSEYLYWMLLEDLVMMVYRINRGMEEFKTPEIVEYIKNNLI